MGNSGEEEGDRFFNANEEIASVSDSSSDYSKSASCSYQEVSNVLGSLDYDFWMKCPQSVNERREKFMRQMGFSLDNFLSAREELEDAVDNMERGSERIVETSGAVLRTSDIEEEDQQAQTSVSCRENDEAYEAVDDDEVAENLTCRIKSPDDGREFIVDEMGHDGILRRPCDVVSDQLITIDEFRRVLGSCNLVQYFIRRGVEEVNDFEDAKGKKCKENWLQKLKVKASLASIKERINSDVASDHLITIDERGVGEVNSFEDAKRKKRKENWPEKLKVKASMASIKERINSEFHNHHPISGSRSDRICANQHRKRSKELSCLYREQDFSAHKGSILTMKFSPDGRYLASGGEDRIVRIWNVTEHERSTEVDISRIDPSCLYFSTEGTSNLATLKQIRERGDMVKKLKKSSDATCIIIPRRLFLISENPLHEFHGHEGEVLDLSWSKKWFLLSSSIDRTVRLWEVGCDQCPRVFPHNDYVTCVQFNPVDDKHFISGSIDGKVRIWKILSCQVVHWIKIKEIVTAICYRPDGKVSCSLLTKLIFSKSKYQYWPFLKSLLLDCGEELLAPWLATAIFYKITGNIATYANFSTIMFMTGVMFSKNKGHFGL
ncbi:hypothetical protein Ancab_015549 [Ancistrocladus abbreviatus]